MKIDEASLVIRCVVNWTVNDHAVASLDVPYGDRDLAHRALDQMLDRVDASTVRT